MEIRPLDVHDDDMLRAYWEAAREADTYQRPYAAFWSYDESVAQLRTDNPTREVLSFVAVEGDTVLGGSNLMCPLLDNQHLGYAGPLVRPGFRRRGAGTAILNAVVEAMRDRRTTLIIEAHKPLDADSSPGWSFLRQHGFTEGILDLHRVLELPVDREHLDELGRSAEPHHLNYRLVTWQDRTPDEWVQGVCDMQSAFNDEAPSGELELEAEAWDEDRLRGPRGLDAPYG